MHFTTGSLISKDGTTISFRHIGKGLPVILLHGGMQSAQDYTHLAQELSDSFEVYIPDRRGRGRSGQFSDLRLSLEQNCDDLDALILKSEHTGSLD